MKSILFQLVLLHAALIWGFGPGGRGRSFAGQPDVADSKKPSFGGDGFPACANDCFQKFHTPNKIGGVCDIKDTKCICNDQKVQTGTNCCISSTCDAADAAKGQKFIQSQCDPFGIVNAGVCPTDATASSVVPAPESVTVSEPVTVPVPVPVTVSATLTSILLATSILTSNSLVVVTSVETDSGTAGGAAATSTVISSATTQELLTTVLSSTNVETTDTPTTIFSNSISTPTGADATPTGLFIGSSPPTAQSPKAGMSSGAKAGVAISVLSAIAFLTVIPFYFWRRRRQQVLDREFQELKEAHESSVARPSSRVVPLYPRAVAAGAGYRDIFGGPDGDG
ncbi:hypothetical protein L207DRAFT_583429 [Hyaloscypha variabilis F]|uniref:CFEM domain-containing protein n=1 Tax=Hyaloscypha variabilis (strain UAMH 11265 / GT02V1 / F) TaxID=1149755 RepID=A0A2J6RM15_HYAVF|nr:hypothetical protein L207DRAFT_583429 [Hyaloscypha variabilis F]